MKKTMLFAAALAVLAFAALPAIASAMPKLDYTGGEFNVSGGAAKLTGPGGVRCSSVTGSGKFTTSETGSVKFIFHGCEEEVFSSDCTTPGSPTGTITTTTLQFHLKTTTGNKTAAILVTPNSEVTSEHFASFECLGGFIGVVVKGNGIIGELTSPGYGTPSNTFAVSFKSTSPGSTTQTPETVDGEETKYHLRASINGGEFEAAAEDAEGTGTFLNGEEPTLTEE